MVNEIKAKTSGNLGQKGISNDSRLAYIYLNANYKPVYKDFSKLIEKYLNDTSSDDVDKNYEKVWEMRIAAFKFIQNMINHKHNLLLAKSKGMISI